MNDAIYKRIAVASTFSPRFEQVLAEAKRVRDRFGAELHLIYVGEKTDGHDGAIRDRLSRSRIAERFRNSLSRWRPGGIDSPSGGG